MAKFRKALEFFSLFLHFHLENRQLSNQYLTDFPVEGGQTGSNSGKRLGRQKELRKIKKPLLPPAPTNLRT